MSIRIVVDTNVFIAALLGPSGASREVVRRCLLGSYEPLMGTALFLEYESLLAWEELFETCRLNRKEREALLNAFLSVCHWQTVYYAWRPNLPDEADNHLVELALAGGAVAIVTKNTRDLAFGELRFPTLRVLQPEDLLKEEW